MLQPPRAVCLRKPCDGEMVSIPGLRFMPGGERQFQRLRLRALVVDFHRENVAIRERAATHLHVLPPHHRLGAIDRQPVFECLRWDKCRAAHIDRYPSAAAKGSWRVVQAGDRAVVLIHAEDVVAVDLKPQQRAVGAHRGAHPPVADRLALFGGSCALAGARRTEINQIRLAHDRLVVDVENIRRFCRGGSDGDDCEQGRKRQADGGRVPESCKPGERGHLARFQIDAGGTPTVPSRAASLSCLRFATFGHAPADGGWMGFHLMVDFWASSMGR